MNMEYIVLQNSYNTNTDNTVILFYLPSSCLTYKCGLVAKQITEFTYWQLVKGIVVRCKHCKWSVSWRINGEQHGKNVLMPYANSEGPDERAHPCSLLCSSTNTIVGPIHCFYKRATKALIRACVVRRLHKGHFRELRIFNVNLIYFRIFTGHIV